MSVADAICASIALPDELPPVRVSDAYTTNPLAIAKVNTDIKINWQGATTGSVPEGDAVAFMFRDALRWLVIYDTNNDGNTYEYNWVQFPSLSSWNVPVGVPFDIPVSAAITTGASTYAPHGNTLFAGDADGRGYIWCDVGTDIKVNTVGIGAGEMYLYTFDNGQRNFIDQIPLVLGGDATYNVIVAGYYNIVVTSNTAGNTVTVRHGDSVGQPVWRHLAVPDVEANLPRVTAMCVSASSLLWRNTASYDNSQGDVGAVIVGPSFEWQTLVATGNASYNGISSTLPLGWKSFFASKGIYAFLKPSDEEDIQLKGEVKSFPQGLWSFARWNLRSTSSYAAVAYSVSLDAGRDTVLRAAAHIQYETNDCWADAREPEANVDDWLTAVKMLSRVPNITENPVHVKDILNSIGKVGLALNNVQTRLAPLATAAASFVPGGSMIAKIGNASLPYQRKGWQYLADYDDGPRTNVDPRQN